MAEQTNKRWYHHIRDRIWGAKNSPASPANAPDPGAVPLSWEEKQRVKDSFSSGTEYFIVAGAIDPRRHQLLMILKAFSEFKKWQRSGMKLIIAGTATKRTKEFTGKLATYKYKDDVLVIQQPEPRILLDLIGAAYALIYFDNNDVFDINLLNAARLMVPVIAGDTPLIAEKTARYGLITPIDSPEELAALLLRLYKDESFRSSQIEKGRID